MFKKLSIGHYIEENYKKIVALVRRKMLLAWLLFFIFSLFILRSAIFHPGVVAFHDWNIPPYREQIANYFRNMLFTWRETFGFDPTPVNWGFFPWLMLYLMSVLGANGAALSIGLILFSLSLSGFSMYYFCIFFKNSHLSSMVAGIFYMLTPWFLNRIIFGDMFNTLTYPLVPFVLLFYKKSISSTYGRNRILYSLAISLLLSFMGIVIAQINILLLIVYSICTIIFSKKRKLELITNMKSLSFVLFGFLVLYSYYLFPLFVSGMGTSLPLTLDDLIQRSENAQLLNSIRLVENPFALFLISNYWAYWVSNFILFMLLWLSLFVKRKNKNIIFFSVLVILSVFLAKGVKEPFGEFYQWLFLNVPYFQAFRDPNKFNLMTCFAYAFLLCESIEMIQKNFNLLISKTFYSLFFKRRTLKYASRLLTVVFCCIVFIGSSPILDGSFSGFLHMANFPKEYREVYEWLDQQKGDFKVLWLPPDSRIIYTWSPFHQYDLMAIHSPKPTALGWILWQSYDEKGRFESFLFSTISQKELKSRYISKLLETAGVRYVILRHDAGAWDFRFYRGTLGDALETNMKKAIMYQNEMELTKKFGLIEIYENKHFMPKIFATSSASLLVGGFHSLISLSYLNDFAFNNSLLLFTDQLTFNESILKYVDTIIIEENRFIDFIFSLLPEDYKIQPSNFANRVNMDDHWSKLYYYQWKYDWSYLDTQKESAITKSEEELIIPFSISKTSEYEIWVKTFLGPKSTTMDFIIDNHLLTELNTNSPNILGYNWIQLYSSSLPFGDHLMKLKNNEGDSVISEIIIAPKNQIEKMYELALNIIRDKQVILLFEVEKIRLPSPTIEYIAVKEDASQGFGLNMSSILSSLREQLFVPKSGTYKVCLRACGEDKLSVKVGNKTFSASIGSAEFNWYDIGTVYLNQGIQSMFLDIKGGNACLDMLVIRSEESIGRSEIVELEYNKINPCEYIIRLKNEKPTFLILTEPYSPFWKASIEGESIDSLPAYSFLNGFFITKTGTNTIYVYFLKQKYFECGFYISIIAFVIMITYIVTEELQKMHKKLRMIGK